MSVITRRPPCGIARHAPDCDCHYDTTSRHWHYDPACTPLRIAGRNVTQPPLTPKEQSE